jgi:TRAP-type C4-dicarboxylate transport system permease large subunit
VLFVGAAVGKIRIEEAVRTIFPFYGAHLVTLLLITYIPAISLTLPNMFK